MSAHRTIAIARRVVQQIIGDRRTLALIFVAPILVMALVGASFSGQPGVLDRVAPALVAAFALFFTFLLTGVSFLRERSQGTLERLLTTPAGRGDILVGYLAGFLLFAMVQSTLVVLYTVVVLDVQYQGNLAHILLLLLVLTITSVSLGIFLATFARNEFQVVQFMPVVLAPQVFLSGIMAPVEQMPDAMQALAAVMPLRYAVDGLRAIMVQGQGLGDVVNDLAALSAFAVVMLGAAAVAVRRT